MYFLKQLEHEILLHPRYFGASMRHELIERLHAEVEGRCSGRHGYIVCVTSVDPIGKGQILDGKGYASFKLSYKAIVFRPFKGEVLDAVVTQVKSMGIFAEVGPSQIFISNHLLPPDMSFKTIGGVPSFQSSDHSVVISKDDEIRLKLIGVRIDASEIFGIGTIKEDYLGLIA